MLSLDTCQKARFSRDPRFDGKFFIAVKTTGIYCRTICPASPPKEENVEYFKNAVQAAEAGYRPCLRCRPDSAPSSAAWQGNGATLNRAVRLIDEGALQTGSIVELATRLGVSDRYLRKLFNEKMGVSPKTLISSGLRLPGIWDVFEAGMRAILGQQISVTAARNLVIKLVETLGENEANNQEAQCENMLYFPTPEAIAQSDLAFFKMPESRKQTMTRFAQFAQNQPIEAQNPDNWLALKGIGPWTANYAKMRGLSDPDIFLATDLGVIKALKAHADFDSEKAAPWRSYLTFQLWDKL
ncbi:MAG: Ada metal-binding domain-containing protein [Pseudomonadota bacterium]